MLQESEDLTALLRSVGGGDSAAADRLLHAVYDDLRRQARGLVKGRSTGQTIQPTALVHEAYLRLFRDGNPAWENRRHFFFAAARAMRCILVEEARRKVSQKRGGGRLQLELRSQDLAAAAPQADVLALDDALTRLQEIAPEGARLVSLRLFGGLNNSEAAEVLDLSLATVERRWRFACAGLRAMLSEG